MSEEAPPPLRDLIPLADRWGIADNHRRDEALRAASDDELHAFVQALANRCSEIDAWLDALPAAIRDWPPVAIRFLWLRKTWHEAACELHAKDAGALD